MPSSTPDTPVRLSRELGLFGAVMMGLGAIVGTGVFVSMGIAAGVTGPAVIPAIGVAALVALCSGMSSAQLAAAHPVSGGTYEYGYRYAAPWLGFTAGWMFLCAKSASAATAALGFAGYALSLSGASASAYRIPLAFGVALLLTAITLTGLRRASRVNIAIVSVTLGALVFFVAAGLPDAFRFGEAHLTPFFRGPATPDTARPVAFLHACALMFVAYTGYGRIATLGEEVREPQRTIPRAIVTTLLGSMLLYMAVGAVGVAAAGADALYTATMAQAAPLEVVAHGFGMPGAAWVLGVGAVTAMAGVLLNLILGLSRVLLAMGRRGDMPPMVARLDRRGAPVIAVVVTGVVIGGLALLGNVRTTWSFSAFTVLVYYAITNACALRLPEDQRRYPRWIAWTGLASCLGLAFMVDRHIWLAGLGLIAAGGVWHGIARRMGNGRISE